MTEQERARPVGSVLNFLARGWSRAWGPGASLRPSAVAFPTLLLSSVLLSLVVLRRAVWEAHCFPGNCLSATSICFHML